MTFGVMLVKERESKSKHQQARIGDRVQFRDRFRVRVRVRVRVRGVRSHIHTTLRVIGFGLVWRRDDLP